MRAFTLAFGSACVRAAAPIVFIAASTTASAQSGIQYDIAKDEYGNVVGELAGNGISIDSDAVDLTGAATRTDIPLALDSTSFTSVTSFNGTVWSLCSNGTVVASPSACPSTAPGSVIGFEGTDVAMAGSDVIFVVGKDGPTASDKYIYRFTSSSTAGLPGAAVRIASAAGTPWVVTSAGGIFSWAGSTWQQMPGSAKDIAANASGVVWVIGSDGVPYKWEPGINNWRQGSGGGTSIAVDPSGNPWLVNAGSQIFRYTGSTWQQLPGAATDIAVAGDGTAYVVGGGGQIYKMPPGAANWSAVPGVVGTRVAAGSSGLLFARLASSTTTSSTTTSSTTTTTSVAPSAPGGLTAKSTTANSTTLTWTGVPNATSYSVKVSNVSGGPYNTINSTSSTSFNVTGLTKATIYYFVVSAKTSSAESANSGQIVVKTTSYLM